MIYVITEHGHRPLVYHRNYAVSYTPKPSTLEQFIHVQHVHVHTHYYNYTCNYNLCIVKTLSATTILWDPNPVGYVDFIA